MTAPVTTPTETGRRPVLLAYGALTALGALFFAGSFAYPWTAPEDGTVGSGALPRTAGLLLAVLGALLIRQEVRTGSVLEGDGHVEEAADVSAEEAHRMRTKLIVVVVTMVVTALLVPFLGLLPALTLMTLFLTAVVERQPLTRSVLVAALVMGLSYLLFVVVLRIPLPFGLFDPAVWSQL